MCIMCISPSPLPFKDSFHIYCKTLSENNSLCISADGLLSSTNHVMCHLCISSSFKGCALGSGEKKPNWNKKKNVLSAKGTPTLWWFYCGSLGEFNLSIPKCGLPWNFTWSSWLDDQKVRRLSRWDIVTQSSTPHQEKSLCLLDWMIPFSHQPHFSILLVSPPHCTSPSSGYSPWAVLDGTVGFSVPLLHSPSLVNPCLPCSDIR